MAVDRARLDVAIKMLVADCTGGTGDWRDKVKEGTLTDVYEVADLLALDEAVAAAPEFAEILRRTRAKSERKSIIGILLLGWTLANTYRALSVKEEVSHGD